MNKEFITFDLAIQLKELGFDEPCIYHYKIKSDDPTNHSTIPSFEVNSAFGKNHNQLSTRVSSPTFSQSFRWFREKYDLHHFIERDGNVYNSICKNYLVQICKTYEEAELVCLKELIEIVKQKL